MTEQEKYMAHALSLAEKGRGWTNPNPMVGAVIVKDNRIIGEGYHHKCGEAHAERNAFANCKEDTAGADLYVTLEPCCHYGRTPPCTELIIEKKIHRVFIGSMDSNPLVAGKGVAFLQNHGISVKTGILQQQCDTLNTIFFHYMKTKMPYVVMKYAMTADGKIATITGKSKWITGELARQQVQELRNAFSGIMVGIGTVLTDDPLLNCRKAGGKNPVRIICDSRLQLPLDSQIVKTAKEIPTIVAFAKGDTVKQKALEQAGITVLQVPDAIGKVDLKALMQALGEREIDSILLEGGGILNESALKAGIVNRVLVYVAPKVFGGVGKSPVAGEGISFVQDAYHLALQNCRKIGEDMLLEYDVKGAE